VEFLQQNWYWAALAVASGAWLLVETVRSGNSKTQLSPVQATLLINREDAVVVDVRDQGEYTAGHIAGSRHIPAAELERRSSELDKFKSRPIILCCATGNRSASALTQLRKAGFEKVYNLRGGIMEWEKAGQPLSRKRK